MSLMCLWQRTSGYSWTSVQRHSSPAWWLKDAEMVDADTGWLSSACHTVTTRGRGISTRMQRTYISKYVLRTPGWPAIMWCHRYTVSTKANSAFHSSGVDKWVPASTGKAKAGMVHSVSGWTRGVQVKLWDPLRTRAIPEHLRGVFTTRRYTNLRLPLPLPGRQFICPSGLNPCNNLGWGATAVFIRLIIYSFVYFRRWFHCLFDFCNLGLLSHWSIDMNIISIFMYMH